MDNSGTQQSHLTKKQIDAIKDGAVKAEKEGRPVKGQLAVLNEHNLLNMLAPQTYGGLQLAVPEALQIVEQLAAADGSIGWLSANAAIASWGKGFLHADTAKELINEKTYVAGTIYTGGTAEKTKGGYTLNGKWKHVTGIGDALAFIANCSVSENGAKIEDEAQTEQVLSFILLKSEFSLLPWNPLGLAGAGSQDVEVKNVKVPSNRAFTMNGEHATNNARLYQYPYLQLSEAFLSVAVAGMAAHFTELCNETIRGMRDARGALLVNDHMVQDTMDKYVQKLNDARVKLYYAAELTWQACANQQTIKDTILYKVSAAAQDLTKKARECADALYPFCGMAAMDKTTELNRIWRDLHTASQERLIVFGGQ